MLNNSEFRKLENKVRKLTCLVTLFMGTGILLGLSAWASPVGTLRATRFELVDKHGKLRGAIYADSSDTVLELLGPAGRGTPRSQFEVRITGNTSELSMIEEGGSVELASDYFGLRDPVTGMGRVVLVRKPLGPKGGDPPYIQLLNEDGSPYLTLPKPKEKTN